MKVAQINAVCGAGSTGRICKELSEMLLQNGHEGVILYGNGSSDYAHSKKVASGMGVKANGLLSRILGKNAAYSPFATKKILAFLADYQPDVVHLHNLHGNFVNVKPLLRYLAKRDIPTVVTLHDCWFFTGKCTHYTAEGCYKWQTGCHDCPKLKADIPSWFFDRTAQMWEEKKRLFGAIPRLAVVGVSDWITNEAKQSFLGNAKLLKRIYNWIDLDVFYPRGNQGREKFGIPADKFTILCIGAGWHKESPKTKDLLALADKLGPDEQILLAGAVDFADELPHNIIFVGYLSSTDELAQLYSACDVYVHLSREDTFGKVIAEALACGTPAVVYDTTACPEILGKGCGYAVTPGDVDQVLNRIRDIKGKGKAAFGSECVSFVQSNFEKNTLIGETMDLYIGLVKCDDIDALESEITRICTERPFEVDECVRKAADFDKNSCFKEYLSLYENS